MTENSFEYGLSEETIKLLCNYFFSRIDIEKVIIFGSRAMGTQARGSDIDLAVFTTSTEDLAGSIKSDLDDLPTPYLFDVVDYERIVNPALKSHIDRVGKILFQRAK